MWTVLVDQEEEGRKVGKKKLEKAGGKMIITRMAVHKMANVYMGDKWEMPALFLIGGDGRIVSVLKGLDEGAVDKPEERMENLLTSQNSSSTTVAALVYRPAPRNKNTGRGSE